MTHRHYYTCPIKAACIGKCLDLELSSGRNERLYYDGSGRFRRWSDATIYRVGKLYISKDSLPKLHAINATKRMALLELGLWPESEVV